MTLTQRILGSRTLAALTSPHGVDRYLELVNPMWAATEVRARVVDVVRETDGPASQTAPVATVTLQPTSTWRGHRAGQYVQVGVEIPGARRTTRCFSISSAESGPGEPFTITVRAHEEGLVSTYLVREAEPGLVVHLSQAEGGFTLTESPATPTNNHLLMISGGSGITPVMSQLRTLLRDGYDGKAGRRVTFLHYARSREDQIFAEELQRIAWADNGVDGAPALRRRRLHRGGTAPPGAGVPRHRHLGLRAGRADGAGARGVRRLAAAAHRVLQALHPPARRRPARPRAT